MLAQVPLPLESTIRASTDVLMMDPLPYQRSWVFKPSDSKIKMMTPLLGVVGILGRRGERSPANERLPAPHQSDRLIGGPLRIQAIHLGLHGGPVVAEAHDRR